MNRLVPLWPNGSAKLRREKKCGLRFLLQTLGIPGPTPAGAIRYQLLHRTASAVITADQYRAVAAMVLVHSFSERQCDWTDYEAFVGLFGPQACAGQAQRLSSASSVPIFAAWVAGDRAFLES